MRILVSWWVWLRVGNDQYPGMWAWVHQQFPCTLNQYPHDAQYRIWHKNRKFVSCGYWCNIGRWRWIIILCAWLGWGDGFYNKYNIAKKMAFMFKLEMIINLLQICEYDVNSFNDTEIIINIQLIINKYTNINFNHILFNVDRSYISFLVFPLLLFCTVFIFVPCSTIMIKI